MRSAWKLAIISAVIFRLITLVIAAGAPYFLPYQPSFAYPHLLDNYHLPAAVSAQAGFDGVHYLVIAEQGYHAAGMIQAFFPIWPLILSLGVVFNTIAWGLVINFFLLIIIIYLWQLLIREVYPDIADSSSLPQSIARLFPILILLLFPTSFFFGALYSETLFLTLVLAAFIAAHRGQWWLAALLAVIVSATRVVGIVLVPALMIELWWQHQLHSQQTGRQQQLASLDWPNLKRSLAWRQLLKFFRHQYHRLALISLGALGLIAYMIYLHFEFGDPLLFKSVQSEWGQERSSSLILYPQVVWRYIKMFIQSAELTPGWWSIGQEFIFGIIAPWLPLLFFKKIRPSHLFFGFGVVMIPILTGTFASLPRYALAAFPIWLSLIIYLQNRPRLAYMWLFLSTLALIYNTILFVQGFWVA